MKIPPRPKPEPSGALMASMRRSFRWSQTYVGIAVNRTAQTISKYERGVEPIPDEVWKAFLWEVARERQRRVEEGLPPEEPPRPKKAKDDEPTSD